MNNVGNAARIIAKKAVERQTSIAKPFLVDGESIKLMAFISVKAAKCEAKIEVKSEAKNVVR